MISGMSRAGSSNPTPIDFAEVSTGLEELEQRTTIGRTVMRTPDDGGNAG
jgi:hypothetical protein